AAWWLVSERPSADGGRFVRRDRPADRAGRLDGETVASAPKPTAAIDQPLPEDVLERRQRAEKSIAQADRQAAVAAGEEIFEDRAEAPPASEPTPFEQLDDLVAKRALEVGQKLEPGQESKLGFPVGKTDLGEAPVAGSTVTGNSDWFLGKGEPSEGNAGLRVLSVDGKEAANAPAEKEKFGNRFFGKRTSPTTGAAGAAPAPGAAAGAPAVSGPATPGPSSPGPATPSHLAPSTGATSPLSRLGVATELAARERRREAEPAPGAVARPAGESETLYRYLELMGRDFDAAKDGKAAKRLRGLGYDGDFDFGVPPTPEELERLRAERLDWILRSCRRIPGEKPRDMFFRFWGDNPFELARIDHLSTFSVDVDTASYALARRYLVEGHLPEKAQVRTEEFVNYFRPDVPPPAEGTFAIRTELAPSLFGGASERWMLRVAIRGREVTTGERRPLALTFVIDCSGSMKEQNRLELVKHSLRLLLGELDGRDSIAIVAFSNESRLVLPMTSAANRGLIESAIFPLAPNGSTNTEAGLRMGYEQAVAGLTANAENRVVLLSDGVANVGITDAQALVAHTESYRRQGIYLNTIGVGMNNHNDALLEQLADKGDGICSYVDDAKEARRALVENFTGAFVPIARDVKVQVDFDPAQVESYRLLGYENRAVADIDFRNDAVDAGEVGSGHQVVALYEIVRSGSGSGEAPLATVRLRWKAPHQGVGLEAGSGAATEIEHAVRAGEAAGSYAATSAGYRRSVLVAQFAEFLRRSVHARGDSLDRLIEEAKKLEGELRDPEFAEFTALVLKSRQLVLAELGRYGDLARTVDELRWNCFRAAQLEDLGRAEDLERIRELERQNRLLEEALRNLLAAGEVRGLGNTNR
ncbi:MAG TPA: von Willebrand factor type A domain-containing protein, partial [Planctomycetota bacterium]|nr:von Willebrand factor type A domain-containing protein [Planctomycetota bacterium]